MDDKPQVLDRRMLEDCFWIGQIFGVLDHKFVMRIINLSQPGTLRTMPYQMVQKHITSLRDELVQKIVGSAGA